MIKNDDKLTKIRDYFEELDIEVPIDVSNSIQDVFDENDNIDGVDLYLKGDVEDFQTDVSLENKIYVSLKGISKGRFVNVFTYYGGLEYSLTEKYLLIKDNDVNEIVDTLHDAQNGLNKTSLHNPNEWAIVLLEDVSFADGEMKTELTLKIYCPISEEELNG